MTPPRSGALQPGNLQLHSAPDSGQRRVSFKIPQGLVDVYQDLRGRGEGSALLDELGVMCVSGLASCHNPDPLTVQQHWGR